VGKDDAREEKIRRRRREKGREGRRRTLEVLTSFAAGLDFLAAVFFLGARGEGGRELGREREGGRDRRQVRRRS